MAKNSGNAASKQTHAPRKAGQSTEKSKVSTISFSLTKTAVREIARVKQWEERSESRTVELSGRR